MKINEIIIEQTLLELFNQPYPYTQDFTIGSDVPNKYIFKSNNGDVYHVLIQTNLTLGGNQGVRTRIDFYNYTETVRDGNNLEKANSVLGTGDAYRIFGTVINILQKYISSQKYPSKTILFVGSAEDPSRIKLYRKFGQMISRAIPGYHLVKEQESNGQIYFYCQRETKNENA